MILRGKEKGGTEWAPWESQRPSELGGGGVWNESKQGVCSRQPAGGIPAQELVQADVAAKLKAAELRSQRSLLRAWGGRVWGAAPKGGVRSREVMLRPWDGSPASVLTAGCGILGASPLQVAVSHPGRRDLGLSPAVSARMLGVNKHWPWGTMGVGALV